MFSLKLGSTFTIFSKFFASADREVVLAAVPEGTRRVVFVDTGVTKVLAETIRALVERGTEVVIRDHHRGEGRNPEAAESIEAILGDNARIVERKAFPACASLIGLGEFVADGTIIVADPDLDGLTAAMQAAGVAYQGMLADADVFDVRPKQSPETLTAVGWTAVRSLSTLPAFDAARPEASEKAKAELFGAFVAAASGDVVARQSLETRVATYEAGVAEAQRLLAEKLSQPCPGVLLADTVGAKRSDLTTLSQGMEKRGARVTAVRKAEGPIAKEHGGIQISLAVAQAFQKEIDLRTLVPEGTLTGVPAGLLSNVPFLLHCSERIWNEAILPALATKLNG